MLLCQWFRLKGSEGCVVGVQNAVSEPYWHGVEIGAGTAGKVCTAYLSCSETTTVSFQHVRQRDSRSQVISSSGGLVLATAVRGQNRWWEAPLSSLQDALQLHLQSSCPQSWPVVTQAQQIFLRLSNWAEQPWNSAMNDKIVCWGLGHCSQLLLWRKNRFLKWISAWSIPTPINHIWLSAQGTGYLSNSDKFNEHADCIIFCHQYRLFLAFMLQG